MSQQIIDTHVHIWDFEKAEYSWLENDTSILKRPYHVKELEEERRTAGVTNGVLVQAANNLDDTNWMLEVAAQSPWIAGVVGWLPLMDPAKTAQLLENVYLKDPYFKGIRHLIHDEPNADWLLQEPVVESLEILASQDLVYDLVGIKNEHIETALAVAEKVPGLKMVFDHLNQPPIAIKEKFGRWGELMKEASLNKNFYAKISGLGNTSQKADWGVSDIEPYIAFVIEQFGADRCFCGGDWPVSLLAGSYTRTWDIYKEVISNLFSEEEQTKLLYSNATGFYKLNC